MALITCPECKHEISDQATVCPSCGYPIAKSENKSPTQSTVLNSPSEKEIKKPTNKKIVFVVAIALLACIFGIYSMNRSTYSIMHKGLGHQITMGMDKSKVDAMFGEGTKSGEYYLYVDGLTIRYEHGKVEWVSLDDNQWETEKGIKIGDELNTVFENYGETEITNIANLANGSLGKGYLVSYYLNRNGNVEASILDAKSNVTFYLNKTKTKVTGISISSK